MGKQEKYKAKKEDNRDVFEKALDYAPAAGGAVAGALLGRGALKYGARLARKDAEAEGRVMTKAQRKALDKDINRVALYASALTAPMGAGLGQAIYDGPSESKKRRK